MRPNTLWCATRRIVMLAGLAAMCVLSLRASADLPITDTDKITTLDVIESALDGAQNGCLNYCITGVCSFLKCNCNLGDCGCKVKIGPQVKHFSPDLVISSYTIGTTATGKKMRNNPWSDINAVIEKLQNSAGDGIMATLTGMTAGAGTGQRMSTPRQHVQMIQKEVDALGHPMASMMESFGVSFGAGPNGWGWGKGLSSGMGGNPAATADDWTADFGGAAEDAQSQDFKAANATVGGAAKDVKTYSGYTAFAATWGSIINPAFADLAAAASDLKAVADQIQAAAEVVDAVEAINNFQNFSFGIGINFFCPSAAQSFFPYYTSALDPIGWRFAIPERLYPEAFLPPIPKAKYTREVGQAPYGLGMAGFTWGNVYPRAGFLGSSDDRTAGAVFAQRAADFITRTGQPHVYIPLKTPDGDKWKSYAAHEADSGTTRWQMLSPVKSSSCAAFGMKQYWPYNDVGDALAKTAAAVATLDLSSKNIRHNSTASYAYTMWRKYKCCAAVGGKFLGSADTPEICF